MDFIKIKELERIRKSRVICYYTSEKQPPFSAQIALDVLPFFYKNVSAIGKVKKISLFLNSNGGSIEVPWPLVSLLREYCDNLEVIVPVRAMSAATLISLGADNILMTSRSQLSPIDPMGDYTTQNNQHINVQVEDVLGYIDFIKNKIGVIEQSALSEALKELTKQVPPTILGSINRTHSQIRSLAEKLINLHNEKLDYERVKKIITNLTEKLYSHQHNINRKEAREIVGFGNIIIDATKREELCINALHEDILREMNLDTDPISKITASDDTNFIIKRALICTNNQIDSFSTEYAITKTANVDGSMGININLKKEGWNL